MPLKTFPWDVTKHLDNDEAIIGYLVAAIEDALEDEILNRELLVAVLADVEEARTRLR